MTSQELETGIENESITIEPASLHIDEIYAIAKDLECNISVLDGNQQKQGFLVYVLEKSAYEKRAKNNDFFISCVINNQVQGFSLNYDRVFLQKLRSGDSDAVINYLYQENNSQENFLYGDQIAIIRNTQRRGIGKLLATNILAKMAEKGIEKMYVDILHKPICNHASINFVTKLGFYNITEVTTSDGLVWGIYLLKRPSLQKTKTIMEKISYYSKLIFQQNYIKSINLRLKKLFGL